MVRMNPGKQKNLLLAKYDYSLAVFFAFFVQCYPVACDPIVADAVTQASVAVLPRNKKNDRIIHVFEGTGSVPACVTRKKKYAVLIHTAVFIFCVTIPAAVQ